MTARTIDPSLQAFRGRIGARLRALRGDAALRLQDIADYLGVTKAAVGHWETGVNPVPVDVLWRLARKYRTTPAAILADEQDDQPDAQAVTLRTERAEAEAAIARLRALIEQAREASRSPTRRVVRAHRKAATLKKSK